MTSTAKESPEVLLEKLPPTSNGFVSDEKIAVFNDKKMGVGRTYRAFDGTTINLYLYDLGHDVIPNGIDSFVVKEAYRLARNDIEGFIKNNLYKNVKVIDEKTTAFHGERGGSQSFLTLAFTTQTPKNAREIISTLYVSGLAGYICKARVNQISGSYRREDIVQFMNIVVERLNN